MGISKRIVWEMPNSSTRVTSFFGSPRQGESEDEYINRIALGMSQEQNMAGATYKIVEKSILNSLMVGKTKDCADKIRFDSKRDLFVDDSVKSEVEKTNETKLSIENKLLSLGLSQTEVDFMMKKPK